VTDLVKHLSQIPKTNSGTSAALLGTHFSQFYIDYGSMLIDVTTGILGIIVLIYAMRFNSTGTQKNKADIKLALAQTLLIESQIEKNTTRKTEDEEK